MARKPAVETPETPETRETLAAPADAPETRESTPEEGAEVAGPPTLRQTIQTHLDEIRAQLQRDDTRRALVAVDRLIALVAEQQHA